MQVNAVKIQHEAGLHARPAALFVQVATKFNSRIWIEKGSKKVNAKSIMGVMSLSVAKGNEIMLTADGKDEVEAVDALKKLIQSNFTEMPV